MPDKSDAKTIFDIRSEIERSDLERPVQYVLELAGRGLYGLTRRSKTFEKARIFSCLSSDERYEDNIYFINIQRIFAI